MPLLPPRSFKRSLRPLALALGVATGTACTRQTHPEPPRPIPKADSETRALPPPTPGTRPVHIETRQLSAADVAVSPDGKFLVFSALGHLFRVSSKGGVARQLTFGPYYDSAPSISPEGSRVAFVSDRDKDSVVALYLLNISSGKLERVAEDEWVAEPVWSPDGKSLGFLSYPAQAGADPSSGALMAQVRRLDLARDKLETLAGPSLISALSFLGDGQLVWSEARPKAAGSFESELVAIDKGGQKQTQLVVDGWVGRLSRGLSPSSVLFTTEQYPKRREAVPAAASLAEVTLPGGTPSPVTTLHNGYPEPRLALADGRAFFGDRGALWQITLQTGKRQVIPVSLKADLELRERAIVHAAAEPRPSVLDPFLLPNGDLCFATAGHLFRQSSAGRGAARLFSGTGVEGGPAAAAPNGESLAYQRSEGGVHELLVVELNPAPAATNPKRSLPRNVTLARVEGDAHFEPAWHPSGTQVAFSDYENGVAQVVLVELGTRRRQKLSTARAQAPGPHFSGDGKWLYFTGNGQVQRVSSAEPKAPEPLTAFASSFAHARVAPGGEEVFFTRAGRIWRVALGGTPARDADAKPFADTDKGAGFSFTSDGRALVFTRRGQVQRLPLVAGEAARALSPVLPSPSAPPPLLVKNVRPLDLGNERALAPISIFADKGRIQWLGPEGKHSLPANTLVLDGGGRFVIPGLIDLEAHLAQAAEAGAEFLVRPEAYVAFGVTSIQDLGADTPALRSLSDAGRLFFAAVPRIFPVTQLKETSLFSSDTAPSEAALREFVQSERAVGTQALVPSLGLEGSLEEALADETLKQGLPLLARDSGASGAVRAAVRGHWALHSSTAAVFFDDVRQLLSKSSLYWAPLISAGGGNQELRTSEPGLWQHPLLTQFWPGNLSPSGVEAEPPSVPWVELIRSAQLGGVRLLAASGSPAKDCLPGHCLHTELVHLVRAGLSPAKALGVVTEAAAEALGQQKDLGTLEPGKLADFVLLDKNPLENIRATLSVTHVVLRGAPFKEGRPFTASPAASGAPSPNSTKADGAKPEGTTAEGTTAGGTGGVKTGVAQPPAKPAAPANPKKP